jgi:ABC-type branched-subunit amino acid transport system substrate-binding protein
MAAYDRLTASVLLAALGACGSPPQPASIDVGVLLDYTGVAASTSFNAERGALLAARLMEQARPGKMPFRLRFKDGAGNPDQARAAAQQLADDGVVAVIGPGGDALVDAVSQPLDDAGVTLVSPRATTGKLSGTAPWYRLSPGDVTGSSSAKLIGENLARALVDRGTLRVAIILDDDVYNRDLVQGFTGDFARYGGTVVTQLQVGASVALVAHDPAFQDHSIQGFIAALSVLAAAHIITEVAATSPSKPVWLLTPRLKSEVFLLNTPAEAVEGAWGLSLRIPFKEQVCQSNDDPQCFVARFKEAWGEEPFEDTYFVYDATALLLIALDKVVGEGSMSPDRGRVGGALVSVAAIGGAQVSWNELSSAVLEDAKGLPVQYSGLTGPIIFTPDGSRRGGATTVWSITGGEIVETGQ